ncbi:TPA: glycosyltransferase family 2 protein [Photobacterium damselae]
MNNKVSIIIPIYNLESYIKSCLDSLLSQTYTNLEIILINDGSTDKSDEIVKEYSKLDNRIKYKTIENGGVTNARKIGFGLASGYYIMFVDGDDTLPLSAIENMLKYFDNDKVDIVISSFEQIGEDGEHIYDDKYQNKCLNKLGYINFVLGNKYEGVLWGRIFKKEIICESYFDIPKDIYLREDSIMNMRISMKMNKSILCNDIGYSYRRRNGSAVSKVIDYKYLLFYAKYFIEDAKNKGLLTDKTDNAIKKYAIMPCLYYITTSVKKKCYDKDYIIDVISYIEELNVKLTIKNKIRIFILKCIIK